MVGAAAIYYRAAYVPAHAGPGEAAYVLVPSLDVVDTPAEVRSVVGQLKAGDRVEVIGQTAHWSKLRMPGSGTGWVESKDLLDGATYERGEAVLKSLENHVPQAAGHTSTVTKLHLDASRDSLTLAELAQNQPLEIFARRVVERPAEGSAAEPRAARARDVWYLVRATPRAGWVLGRFVDLDVPAGIAAYAHGINMVAWLVLKTVEDGGKNVPEYLVADRIGAEEPDFNHIRVFTWWVKNHKYVTAYRESGLEGHFPIQAKQMTDTDYYAKLSPYFRLRLNGDEGERYQKVYGLFDTIVVTCGAVDGWDSDAMPAPVSREERVERKRGRARRVRGRR